MESEPLQNQSRRQFIKLASVFAVALPTGIAFNSFCQAQTDKGRGAGSARVGGYCEGCEGIYEGMPQQLNWQTTISPAGEPGEPMEISGVIYRVDGKTPAPNIILYVYHTDAAGYYTPAPNQTGNARRHGHLRGWMKTNEKGEYRFISIKPAPYPNGRIPAHIHPILKEADKNEYFIDEYVFDDDPLVTREERGKHRNLGGSGIIRLTKNGNGVWAGKRDIILGLNVPNYY
jgi:protocatechuate 3,4-dioxygenase beta subunit